MKEKERQVRDGESIKEGDRGRQRRVGELKRTTNEREREKVKGERR